MIAIASCSGRLLRTISHFEKKGSIYGFHKRFGLVSEKTAETREQNRKRFGLSKCRHQEGSEINVWDCQFRITPKKKGNPEIVDVGNCQITKKEDIWWIKTPTRSFQVSDQKTSFAPLPLHIDYDSSDGKKIIPIASLLLSALLLVGILFPYEGDQVVEVEKKEEPIVVKVVKPKRAVTVPVPRTLKGIKKFAKKRQRESQVRRAVAQNLGLLGVLGERGLRKALGGTPSRLKDVSPGAGPGGGKGGSGGELLVGLGKGIRKTTVGNTGTVGLGGIGTKGKGGGQGGYGNTSVSSGVGPGSLSNLSLGEEIVMEGGLSQSVIEATIVKYLPQIRACYEIGLRKSSGLSGTVATKFEIGPQGRLNYSKVSRSTLGSAEVEDCIVRNMKNWQFPRPEGGVNVRVNYPFLLRPVRL